MVELDRVTILYTPVVKFMSCARWGSMITFPTQFALELVSYFLRFLVCFVLAYMLIHQLKEIAIQNANEFDRCVCVRALNDDCR